MQERLNELEIRVIHLSYCNPDVKKSVFFVLLNRR